MNTKRDDLNKLRTDSTVSFVNSFLIREKLAAISLPEEDCETSGDISLRAMNPFNPFPVEGQVRLLSQVDQIVYVLLARRWNDNAFLVIPFSQYDDPATDLELKMKVDAGAYLRVLQIWNARTLQAETLRKSWLIGKMNVGDLDDALKLWAYSVGGEQPDVNVLERTGMPIFRRDDPRIRYQDNVLHDFARLDAEDLATAEKGKSDSTPVLKSIWTIPRARLAAGDRNVSTVRRSVCRVKGFAGELEIVYSEVRKSLSLEVFDQAGEVCSELDGWRFMYHDGTDFGVVTDGRVIADNVVECDGACCLLDPEGHIRVLMPKKGR